MLQIATLRRFKDPSVTSQLHLERDFATASEFSPYSSTPEIGREVLSLCACKLYSNLVRTPKSLMLHGCKGLGVLGLGFRGK